MNDENVNSKSDTENKEKPVKASASKKKSPEVEIKEEVVQKETAVKSKSAVREKVDLPLDMLVECKNGTPGKLIYVSKRQQGYQETWANFGDSAYIELAELISMRNTKRKFFEQNWIIIDDVDVLKYLKVDQYYKGAIPCEELDGIFDKNPAEMVSIIEKMSNGLKTTVQRRAFEKVRNGQIDSKKAIAALENALNCKFE